MVDLNRIRSSANKPLPTDPVKIFERQPKPEGVNDLWKSQNEVLREWQARRANRDIVIKLNTGGGKTLVGLLISQAVMNETRVGALYLCANNQLVDQTLEKARQFQFAAVRYEAGAGKPLPAAFVNGDAILIATYRSLFHGYSKFKVRGRGTPVQASVIVCDDAHTAFSDVREAFSVTVTRAKSEVLYRAITTRLRPAAIAANRLGSYDHMVGGQDLGVFEVPYWSWRSLSNDVRDLLSKHSKKAEYEYQLPLVLDRFDAAHVLVRASEVMITTMQPPVDALPTFVEAPHRVYMSATIADDSALVRTFGAAADAIEKPIAPESLAGVGERMILAPALTPIGPKAELETTKALAIRVAARKLGVVVLSPSEPLAKQRWGKAAKVVVGEDVTAAVEALNDRARSDNGPYAFANRYDGVDLAQDACRLLIFDGLPRGASAYDEYRANALRGSSQIELSLAQRVEQGLGRGTRGAGDYCVVILLGNVQDWVSRRANAAYMTPATRAQLELGLDVSKSIVDLDDFDEAARLCLDRKPDWVKLHAEELVERTAAVVAEATVPKNVVAGAQIERAYFEAYASGGYRIAKELTIKAANEHSSDRLFRGWLLQLAARAAFYEADGKWGEAADLQAEAARANSMMLPPPGEERIDPLPAMASQSKRIAEIVAGYERSDAYIAELERSTLALTGNVTAAEFETGIRALGEFLGFSSERLDRGANTGPDNVWRTDDGRIAVISCKNEKRQSAVLSKRDLAQLYLDAKWIEERHPDLKQILIVAHPSAAKSEHLPTEGVWALTTNGLSALVGATKVMAGELARSGGTPSELERKARELLKKYDLTMDAIQRAFLVHFAG